MSTLSLYLRYAVRSFVRGRTRSLFGAFCVAVGVASIVALGLAGGNFKSAVTANAQKQNRGDVSIVPPASGLTLRQIGLIEQMKARRQITDYTTTMRDDALIRDSRRQSTSTVGSITGVDPQKFPFYDAVTADAPTGVPLTRLLSQPGDAVVSHSTFATLHLRLGATIHVDSRQGFTHAYTVTGIVPDSAIGTGLQAALFDDFVMVDISSMKGYFHGLDVGATSVYLKTSDAAHAAGAKRTLTHTLEGLSTIQTVADVQKSSNDSAASMNIFFRISGLVAVIIGGIGILNTMLVAARRRTKEIAVLKSLGLKGRQVMVVFTLESLVLATGGVVVGVALGIAASLAVNGVTESISAYSIPWSLQAGPIIAGAAVGFAATVLFGYFPILRASQARPVSALRSDSLGLPRQGRIRTGLLVLGLAGIMGYLAVLYTGLVAGPQALLYGIIGGIGALIAAGALTQLFVLIVWATSKLPSMGRLSARMAFRSMGTNKRRLGSTLLALSIGILSIGSSTILAQNIKDFAAQSINNTQHINVAIQMSHSAAATSRLDAELLRLPGLEQRKYGAIAGASVLASVDGTPTATLVRRALAHHSATTDTLQTAAAKMRGIEGRNLGISQYTLTTKAGRNLDKRDVGTDHMVVSADVATPLGISVGSRLVFSEGNSHVPFTVVGIGAKNNFTIFGANIADLHYMQRMGLTTATQSHATVVYLQIKDSALQSDITVLRRALPHALVLDLGKFLTMFNGAIDKLALFPQIIAALSLFAGAVIIANTVALAMLERRREIGVLKAVGAKRRTILQFLFVENAIVGFIGAGVGVLLAMVVTVVADQQLLKISPSFSLVTIVPLIVLGMALSVGAGALTALPASSEKPMNVLRYE